ncbi:hypothetical protein GGX14DRAFT_663764 [Mycena pura]|uniref:Zn(2)-C6 fungal-type domain-containing protein n=1 Tax=Mycena pura TaxID=153505 RepID=A0AAD7E079_9AGAR|nr:hypothetical protein GGX14DRAFT_663764 [Mycena pura]
MSSPHVSPKIAPKATNPPAEGDHRKRRRNRTTQSCLNCHATKRMCDRKRPCSRCSQLGLTGNCVYEVDDPSKKGKQDEGSRLMGRIAELEGVIRELKHKPHPRWMAERDNSSGPDTCHPSPPSSGGSSPPSVPAWSFPPSPRLTPASDGAFPSSACDNDSVESLLSMYAGLTEYMYFGRGVGNCSCIADASCYHVVLELSLRLRKAADILACSPSHSTNSVCALNTRISALDTLLKNSLLNLPTSTSSPGWGHSPDIIDISSTHFGQPYGNVYSHDLPVDDLSNLGNNNDDFMSWMPAGY